MRAICEACSGLQPTDWQPGDLCILCGQAVRRELRCYWCAKWTPVAKFCRVCGAAEVEPSRYGAAGMLKDAGTDRFTIPKLLPELEPDQIENFTRIYQEHAAVATHHVDQVVFLEQYLSGRHWSGALEERLMPELPWPLERLESIRHAAQRIPAGLEGLDKVRAIQRATPFDITRSLAAIARVTLDDWAACDEAAGLLRAADEALRREAAVVLSSWRVQYGPGLPDCHRDLAEVLSSAAPLPVSDFAAALAAGDADFLTASMRDGDPLMQYAAARRLIELGVIGPPLADAIRTATPERQILLLWLLEQRKQPVPDLREALFDVAAAAGDRNLHRVACTVLCLGCPPQEVLRLARAARGSPNVYQAILQRADLPPEGLQEFGEYLLSQGAFRADQFGMRDVAKQGRMPADFVARQWAKADSPSRRELCRFAEMQLGEYGDEALHRFLVDVAFTPGDAAVQSDAWSCLYRWYDSFGFPRRRPLAISPQAIAEFFGTPQRYLTRLREFFQGRQILHDSLQRDRIAEMLRYPDPQALAAFEQEPAETMALAETLVEVMWDVEVDLILRLACADFLGFLGKSPAFRSQMTRFLKTFEATDVGVQCGRALDGMRN